MIFSHKYLNHFLSVVVEWIGKLSVDLYTHVLCEDSTLHVEIAFAGNEE